MAYYTFLVLNSFLLDWTVRVCTCARPCVDLIFWKDGTLDLPHMGFGSCPLAARRHMSWRHCAHFLCLLFSLWAYHVYACVYLCTSACAHSCVRRALIWRDGWWFSAGIWPWAAFVVRMNATHLWFGLSSSSWHHCLTLSSRLSPFLPPCLSHYLPLSRFWWWALQAFDTTNLLCNLALATVVLPLYAAEKNAEEGQRISFCHCTYRKSYLFAHLGIKNCQTWGLNLANFTEIILFPLGM